MAVWLDTVFYSFDKFFINGTAGLVNGFFNAIFLALSVIFEKGILIILTSLILILFKKTRKVGGAMLLALLIGALITNVTLKDLVKRERPFTKEEYLPLWHLAGAVLEGEYSFPSGHATSVMAASTALFIICNKKWSFVGFILTFIIAVDRVYLVVHYPTDVIAGLIVGGIAGIISCYVVNFLYNLADKGKSKFLNWCVNFDVSNIFNKGEGNK